VIPTPQVVRITEQDAWTSSFAPIKLNTAKNVTRAG
jgi:hypothetical protein